MRRITLETCVHNNQVVLEAAYILAFVDSPISVVLEVKTFAKQVNIFRCADSSEPSFSAYAYLFIQ